MLTLDSEEMKIVGRIIRKTSLREQIQVIKLIRELTSCGLKEAKDFFDEHYSKSRELDDCRNRINELTLMLNEQRNKAEGYETASNNLRGALTIERHKIDFLKSIIFQYDEFNSDSLYKAMIAYIATRSKNE